MAQTGYTPISIYYSSTSTNVPTAGNLVAGELAINTADGKLFYKDSAGVVQVIGTKGGVGSSTTTQVLYNSSGLVVGSANMTFSGTALTLANDASISGLTVGKGGGAVASNTALGVSALTANTSGSLMTAVGYQALQTNSTGDSNTAVGYRSLNKSTGTNCTAIGYLSGYNITSGANNNAMGTQALYLNTTGASNTALGDFALYSNTTGISNTAIGYQSLYSNTTYNYNTAVGYQSAYSSSTGSYNAVLGYNAYRSATVSNYAVAIGANAMYNFNSLTLDCYNVAVGYQSLTNTTTGNYNTAIGYQAGKNVTTGYNNVFVTYGSTANITTGYQNILIGNDPNNSISSINNCINMTTRGSTDKGSSTGFIDPNGGGVYQGNNSATWSITSDARLKKNIVDNTIGLSAITAIQVRNFEYRTKDEVTDLPQTSAIEITGVQLGAIAQELQAILPDCVKTESTGVMSVNSENLTWYLINAVKELNAKIIALENK